MRLLLVSDGIDPLVYSTASKERFANIDCVLCAGDLPMEYIDFIVSTLNKPCYFIFGNHNLEEYHHYHKLHDAKIELGQVQLGQALDLSYSHGAVYCGFKTVADKSFKLKGSRGRVTPLLIAGASGSLRYSTGQDQWTNTQMLLRLLLLVPSLLLNKLLYGRYLDIFLTHAAPRGTHDKEDPCHKGFECFNWFMKVFTPRYLVHGHIHLYDVQDVRKTIVYKTCVVNAYSHYVIELDEYSEG